MERVSGRNIFDYMIMFIPNEGLFNLIVAMDSKEDERGLLWFAYSQKVIIAGPSTILALLAIIDRMWQSHEVEEKQPK
jgi:DNA anti-recombination protein RmuC